MKIKELKVRAVIPYAEYANLQPEITIDVEDDIEAAQKEAMSYLAEFSEKYAQDGKEISSGQPKTVKARKLIPYVGEGEVFIDDNHNYFDKDGNVFESGSKFAKRFEHPFNAEAIVPRYAAKFGVEQQDVIDFWKAKGESSTTFGTALHQALETAGKFNDLSVKLSTKEKPVTLGIHPTLLPIVEAFFTEERLKENAAYEPFVIDQDGKRCGQIDRLVIVDEATKMCDIEDYKTNADLYKQNSPKFLKAPYDNLPNQPISIYTLQLNFYRAIMEANGWMVRAMKIPHWDGKEWKMIEVDKVNIEEK